MSRLWSDFGHQSIIMPSIICSLVMHSPNMVSKREVTHWMLLRNTKKSRPGQSAHLNKQRYWHTRCHPTCQESTHQILHILQLLTPPVSYSVSVHLERTDCHNCRSPGKDIKLEEGYILLSFITRSLLDLNILKHSTYKYFKFLNIYLHSR